MILEDPQMWRRGLVSGSIGLPSRVFGLQHCDPSHSAPFPGGRYVAPPSFPQEKRLDLPGQDWSHLGTFDGGFLVLFLLHLLQGLQVLRLFFSELSRRESVGISPLLHQMGNYHWISPLSFPHGLFILLFLLPLRGWILSGRPPWGNIQWSWVARILYYAKFFELLWGVAPTRGCKTPRSFRYFSNGAYSSIREVRGHIDFTSAGKETLKPSLESSAYAFICSMAKVRPSRAGLASSWIFFFFFFFNIN